MINITIKQLRYFEALAREGHFGRAAESCSVTQPALSIQIKEMEHVLGAPLFERGPKHVRLTSFGESVADRIGGILRGIEDLGEMADAVRGGFVGRLRMGVIPTIAPYLLPRIIGTLIEAYPKTDVQIRESMTSRLLEELGEGRIDCALVALPVSETNFEEVPLCAEPMLLVRHQSARHEPMPTVDSLRDMRLLLLEEGHCFRDQALSFCKLLPSNRWDGLDGSSLSTLVQMVAAGIGVTLIPEIAVPVETRSTDVVVHAFPEPQPMRTLGLIWRKSSPLSQELHGISDLIRTAIETVRKDHAEQVKFAAN
jgi:LysR family transcriptional regulator, hydrogen peroxide-inducible genes activator